MAARKACVHSLSRVVPYYIVNEFPKSGGTWLTLMIAEALGLRAMRNTSIAFRPCVVHGHFLRPLALGNVLVMWRDPRDVLVSFYYHCFFRNEEQNGELVRLMKLNLPFEDYSDVRSNLPRFIRFVTDTPFAPSYNWVDFARIWAGREGTVQASYENLRAATSEELVRIIRELAGITVSPQLAAEVAENHSFAKAKARADARKDDGVELSFVREGSTGGWRKHFSPEALGALASLGYGEPMRKLGYEL